MGKDKVRVQCLDCEFSRAVTRDGEIRPADVLIDHGQETGHTLTVETEEESAD